MKNEINEHRLRLNILEKHISSDFYKTGHLHNKISDAMKEYAEQVNDVDTSHDKALNLADVIGRFDTKDISNITDGECYEIAVLDGWKTLWEGDRGGKGTVKDDELIQRGRDIVNGEINGRWINADKINGYLFAKGYKALNAL